MSLVLYILVFMGLMALIFIGVDWIIAFNKWQRRIHIGRWYNDEDWLNAVEDIAKRWLFNTPVVKQSDNNRLILWDIIRGNYKKQAIQSWQEAGLIMGLCGNSIILNFIDLNIDSKTGLWKDSPREVDSALKGYALMRYSGLPSDSLKTAMDQIYKRILEVKGTQTSVPYRKEIPEIRFVDTIGLITPFLMLYGKLYRYPEAIQLAMNQIREYDIAKLNDSQFSSHAYNIQDKRPLGIFDWGRGIGWYILGLTECLKVIKGDNEEYAISLKKRMELLANELLSYQRLDGSFSDMIFNSHNNPESSSTILAGVLFLEVYKESKDEIFLNACIKIRKALMSFTQRNGAIDYCQGDTKGVGCYSQIRGYMPFVQGLTLLFAKDLRTVIQDKK